MYDHPDCVLRDVWSCWTPVSTAAGINLCNGIITRTQLARGALFDGVAGELLWLLGGIRLLLLFCEEAAGNDGGGFLVATLFLGMELLIGESLEVGQVGGLIGVTRVLRRRLKK